MRIENCSKFLLCQLQNYFNFGHMLLVEAEDRQRRMWGRLNLLSKNGTGEISTCRKILILVVLEIQVSCSHCLL